MAQSKSSPVRGLKALLWCSFILTTTTRISAFDRPQAQVLDAATKATLLPRERYVATNRFAGKRSKVGKFEQRWTTRKSRLAELDGFKYFHLMRRVTLGEKEAETPEEEKDEFGNYVSFTVWDEKENFDDWRKGDAFKEAHGGTSIVSFLSTMINSAMVMNGPPRPAFYDALLVQSKPPENLPELKDGWRDVEADGITLLPEECFVACNQFFVPADNMAAFEQRWAERKSRVELILRNV
jgi:heme-degrading monooxygenase HmoA